MSELRSSLEARLAAGGESALLRFSLGSVCFHARKLDDSLIHLERAVALDPDYSAAWALLGKAKRDAGDWEGAIRTFERGITVADRQGDVQAARQMRTFMYRLDPRSS